MTVDPRVVQAGAGAWRHRKAREPIHPSGFWACPGLRPCGKAAMSEHQP